MHTWTIDGRMILYWLALWGLSLEGISQGVNQNPESNELER